MIQSQQVLEWQAQARVEARIQEAAANVIAVLEDRFQAVPAELAAAISALTDATRLRELLRLAATSASLDDFRSRAQLS